MSTNTPEAQDLLRLFKCVVDTGTDVLAAFAKFKLLPSFNGNLELFLEDRKHEIFHLWQSHKSFCCACPAAGCNLKRINRIDNWIFKKIYDDNGPENKGHIVYSMGKVVQVCLHKYLTRKMAIHDLDISVIACLLRNLANLSPNETSALDIITTTRSQVCHAYSTNCYPLTLLNTTWTELENALVDLADPSYKRIIQKQIKYLRKVDLEMEEITELTQNVEELNIVLQEVSDMQKVNNGIIKNGFKTCENQISKAKKEIIQNTDKKLAEMKDEMQKLRATINILIEQKPRSPKKHNDEHKERSMHCMDKTSVEEMYDQQGAKPKKMLDDTRQVCATCHIEGEELDEQSAVQLLPENNHSHASTMCFNIITAEQKCLLLQLKASSKIFKDIQSFRLALRVLLNQIVQAGKIDINKPSTITLWLVFKDDLTKDERKVVTEMSGHSFISRRTAGISVGPPLPVAEKSCWNCENLQIEVKNHQTDIRPLEDKIQDLESKNQELESKNQDLESKNIDLESRNKELKSENQVLKSNIIELENRGVLHLTEKLKLESEISQLKDMVILRSDTPTTSVQSKRQKQVVEDWLLHRGASLDSKGFHDNNPLKAEPESSETSSIGALPLCEFSSDELELESSESSGTGSMMGSRQGSRHGSRHGSLKKDIVV